MFSTEKIEVNLDLKVFTISGTFKPKKTDKKAAWELYIELITRITVIELKEGHGILREAFNSIYSLFNITRSVLKKYGPDLAKSASNNLSLGLISVSMLNHVLRPFLTKWHPLLEEYEVQRPKNVSKKEHEDKWEYCKKTRDELEKIRETLNLYADLLSQIAGVDPIHNKSVIT